MMTLPRAKMPGRFVGIVAQPGLAWDVMLDTRPALARLGRLAVRRRARRNFNRAAGQSATGPGARNQ